MQIILKDVRKIWAERSTHGIELLFDTALLLLRRLSVSYWLKRAFPDPAEGKDRRPRDLATDIYCVFQLVLLIGLLYWSAEARVTSFIATYILFEIYLNLLNIVFIGKHGRINVAPASIERSVLLMLVNVIQIVLVFAIYYHQALCIPVDEALYAATLVLGTVGTPRSSPASWRLVELQITLDIVFVVLFFGSFAGQLNLFAPRSQRRRRPLWYSRRPLRSKWPRMRRPPPSPE